MSDPGSNTVRAAGAVLWRHVHTEGWDTSLSGECAPVEVALVHRPHYGDWSLPKGKLHNGETVAHGAVRELVEETGFTARLSRRLGTVEYPAPRPLGWRKSVVYFSACARNGSFSPNNEVDELRWLSVEQAGELATHDSDRLVLD
ncbi:MAG: NUDIX hydrolase, partial [Sciscionella sp.]